MAVQQKQEHKTLEEIWNEIQVKKRKNQWDDIVALKRFLPKEFGAEWLAVADELAFALSQKGRYDESVAISTRSYELEPTYRRASGIAYQYYAALLEAKTNRKVREQRDRRLDMEGFEAWIERALDHRPTSIKDWYRLATYYSQVQARKDKLALQAYQNAIKYYGQLSPAAEERFTKTYVLSLYGAARSAMRLKRQGLASRLISECLVVDEGHGYMDDQYKYGLAGKIAAATGRWADAEQALRKAVSHPSHNHWYLYGELAKVCLATGRVSDAARWIEDNVPVHRRKSVLWRLLGDVRVRQGRIREAEAAFRNALHNDRAGRHLTLVRLGRVLLAQERFKEARKAFKDANKFRTKHYMSQDRDALAGLVEVSERQGNEELAADYRERLRKLDEERSAKRYGTSSSDESGRGPGQGPATDGSHRARTGEAYGHSEGPDIEGAGSRGRTVTSKPAHRRLFTGLVESLRDAVIQRGTCLLPDGVTRAARRIIAPRKPRPMEQGSTDIPSFLSGLGVGPFGGILTSA